MKAKQVSNSTIGAIKMSKTEQAANTIRKTYKYFDLDTFDNKEETVDVPFTAPATLKEATAAIKNDGATILAAITAYLRAEALAKAEQEIISKGGKKSVVLAVMKPFRAMPPFNSYFILDSDGKKTLRTRKTRTGETVTEPAMDKARQDKEILALLKANPALIASIKQASLEAVGTEDEENDED